jgi:hypothetical protein
MVNDRPYHQLCTPEKRDYLIFYAPGAPARKIRAQHKNKLAFFTTYGTFDRSTGHWIVDKAYYVTDL